MLGLVSQQLGSFTHRAHETALTARPCWHCVCYEPRSLAPELSRARAQAES